MFSATSEAPKQAAKDTGGRFIASYPQAPDDTYVQYHVVPVECGSASVPGYAEPVSSPEHWQVAQHVALGEYLLPEWVMILWRLTRRCRLERQVEELPCTLGMYWQEKDSLAKGTLLTMRCTW
jgi:hypothetical protein